MAKDAIKLSILRWEDHPGLTWTSPRYNHMYLEETGRGRFDTETEERTRSEGRGRDWSDVDTSQGKPAATRSWKRLSGFPLEPPEGMWSC